MFSSNKLWAMDKKSLNTMLTQHLISLEKGAVDAEKMLEKNKAANTMVYAKVSYDSGTQEFSSNIAVNKTKSKGDTYVAIIPVKGVMQRNFDSWAEVCSTNYVRSQISSANSDPEVSGIVLLTDTPGGTVDGTYELANTIKESKKPVVVAISGLCASAGMWVASAADAIYATTPVSMVGSIGVITQHADVSKMYEEFFGIKVTMITSDGDEAKAYGNAFEPLQEDALNQIKSQLNSIKTIFTKAVKSGRKKNENFTQESLIPTVVLAEQGIALGLIDKQAPLSKAVLAAYRMSKPSDNSKKSKSVHNNQFSTNMRNSFIGQFISNNNAQVHTEPLNLSVEDANALETNLKETVAKLEDSQNRVVALEDEKLKLVAEKDKLASANSELSDKLSTSEANLAEANTKVTELEAKNAEVDVESLKAENETLKQHNESLKETNAVLVAQYEALEQQNSEEDQDDSTSELQVQLEALKAEKEALNAKVSDLTNQISAATEEYNALAKKAGMPESNAHNSKGKSSDNPKRRLGDLSFQDRARGRVIGIGSISGLRK